MTKIAIIILAAGSSSRMRSIKQLEKIENKTLLEITLEKANKIQNKDVFCVLGANAQVIKTSISSENVHFIFNKNFTNGLSSSIVTAMSFFKKNNLSFDGFLILLADQPNVEIEYLKNIIELFNKNPDNIIASNYGDSLGVPALISKKYIHQLQTIKGDKGAKEFINTNKKDVIVPENTTDFFDVDTQEDLISIKQRFKKM